MFQKLCNSIKNAHRIIQRDTFRIFWKQCKSIKSVNRLKSSQFSPLCRCLLYQTAAAMIPVVTNAPTDAGTISNTSSRSPSSSSATEYKCMYDTAISVRLSDLAQEISSVLEFRKAFQQFYSDKKVNWGRLTIITEFTLLLVQKFPSQCIDIIDAFLDAHEKVIGENASN